MRKLIMGTMAYLLLLGQALAGDLTFKYGVGVGLPEQGSIAEVKLFELGYQVPLTEVIHHKLGVGVWADSRNSDQRKSAGYGSYSLGVRVEPGGFYAESFWGVAGITHTDQLLSSVFEFTQDFAVGAQDRKGRFIGVSYKHFSNAGITLPNRGRDFVIINVGFPI